MPEMSLFASCVWSSVVSNGYLCVRLLIGFGIDSIESLLKPMVRGRRETGEADR